MPHTFDASDIIRNTPDAIISIGMDHRILSMNPVAEALTGYTQAEALGRPCAEVLNSDLCNGECPFRRAIETGQHVPVMEAILTRRSGEQVRVAFHTSVLKNAAGEQIGIVEDIRDISAASDSTRVAGQLTAVLESMGEGVACGDLNCVLTSFNRAAENILGYTRQEVIGKGCKDIFGGEFCPMHVTLSQGAALPGSEVMLRARDGSSVPAWLTTSILRGCSGQPEGVVVTFADLREVRRLKEQISGRCGFDTLVGKSSTMQRICDRLQQVASSTATVLVTGESGTGKELIAALVHAHSPRWKQPFVKVNCAALPETLLESELFGHVRGAFAGASMDKPGRFELANGGTILLDEISELSLPLQTKVLRVLQEREFERAGGTRAIRADVRVIAATNRNLDQMVESGSFRRDLFYRLSVVPIRIPPLRERPEDIAILAEHFLRRIAVRSKQAMKRVTPAALKLMLGYHWPGNVRELENAMEFAAVSTNDDWLRPEALPERVRDQAGEAGLSNSLALHERDIIVQALASARTLSGAARKLNISRPTLWRKMKKLSVPSPDRSRSLR